MRFQSLVLSLALLAPGLAEAGPLQGVTPCDVRRLTAYYGTEAKVRQVLRSVAKGYKVVDTGNGQRMNEGVFYEVEGARKVPAKCTFGEAGYDYADSVLLAQVWGVDPAAARKIVEQQIAIGDEYSVIWALEDARSGKIATPPTAEDAALEAFLSGDLYTACDARLLATAWRTDLTSAKTVIGEKLRARQDGALESLFLPIRQAAVARGESCEFWETGHTYEDAEFLAAAWRTSVPAAKARVGAMVIRGENAVLRAMLRGG